jgi:threonine/homoserine/homoserine lactone efflux protein
MIVFAIAMFLLAITPGLGVFVSISGATNNLTEKA